MADVLVIAPGAVNGADKAALRKAGIVVIETRQPDSIRFLTPCTDIRSDELAAIAIEALARSGNHNSEHSSFVKAMALAARVAANRTTQTERKDGGRNE